MKILINSCHFSPEPIGIGKFTGETANWLAAQGHDVRVVCAPPSYPQRKIAEGYSGFWFDRRHENGVDVLRSPLWVNRGQGGAARVLQYLSYTVFSAPAVIWWGLVWRPDVVMTIIPPSSAILASLIGAALGGAKTWSHVQDFDIDAAFELNILNSRWIKAGLLWMERRLMSGNDVVSSITPPMIERLHAKRVDAKITQFPNWSDLETIYPLADVSPLRRELGIPDDAFVALYCGNLGQKQGLDVLFDVARAAADTPSIRIVIGGDGNGRAHLEEIARGVANVQMIPLQPLSRLNELLNIADVHLLPQRAGVADMVMPSKLGGMLASGRPVIAGAAAGTNLANEVAECGAVVAPDNGPAMSAALLSLFNDSARRARLGVAARQRALSHWDKAAVLSAFENELKKLCGVR